MVVPLEQSAASAADDAARFNPELLGNVVFAPHNLATDQAFAEFHAVPCRNVLIYFDTALQHRVTDRCCASLRRLEVRGPGWVPLVPDERIVRKAA